MEDIWRDVRRDENQFDKRDLRKLPGPLTFDEIKRRLAEEKKDEQRDGKC